MKWQDALISVGSVIFAIALIPTLRGPAKPALTSSLITASMLYLYSVVYVSYRLWYALATGLITAICWSVLAYQRYRQLSQHRS